MSNEQLANDNKILAIHNSHFTFHMSPTPPLFHASSLPAFQPSPLRPPHSSNPSLLHSSALPFFHLSNVPVFLLILIFALFFSILSIQQHHTYQTHGLDIGNVDQALWNTAQGRFLNFTLMAPVENRLALHVEPILLLLVPFYWIGVGGPELLLAIQATVVALGAWPLYQLAILNLRPANPSLHPSIPPPLQSSNPPSFHPYNFSVSLRTGLPTLGSYIALVLFIVAYLLLPTLQSAVLFDFHAVTLAPTFLLFAFLAFEQQSNGRFALFAVLAMACKEDMPLVVALVGLYAGLAQRRWRFAGLTTGLSLLWFFVAVFVIQPSFASGGNIQMDRYAWLGANPLQMLANAVLRPGVVIDHLWNQANLPAYAFNLFFPTAFLALLSPLTLLPILPPLAVNLLSDTPLTWRLEDFHYGAPLAPFLFISTIYGVRRLASWWNKSITVVRRDGVGVGCSDHLSTSPPLLRSSASLLTATLLTIVFIFSLLYHHFRGYTPLARPFQWPQTTTHHQQLDAILRTIPADTPLFAQSNLAPHLTQRPIIYDNFAYFTDPDFPAAERVQHILLDVTSLENIGGLHQYLQQNLLDSGDYQLIAAQDGILHLAMSNEQLAMNNEQLTASNSQFTIPNSQLPPEFYTFTQPTSPSGFPLRTDFGDALRLHGFSLHFNRQEEIQVSVDLAALRPLDSIQPVLYLLDAEGQPQGATTDFQPALIWYPVERWPVGETVRVRFNTLPWHTREINAYRLALGVIRGNDPWTIGTRLSPTLSAPTGYAVRLPDNGTLVELAEVKQVWSMPAGGPRLRRFSLPNVPYPVEADFGRQIRLLGYDNLSSLTSGDGPLSIRLYWQALAEPEHLTRFVQLVGPDGQLYGQRDSDPDHGQYPTFLWQPGQVVIETVTFSIQPDRPAGAYKIHLGLYRSQTGHRLALDSGGDHVEIAAPSREQ